MALEDRPDDLDATRRSLLERVKNWEDQESWGRFFNTYSRLIYSVALKAGLNDQEANDTVQETMLSVAKKIRSFNYDPKIGKFRNWLIHTTEWRIRDQWRKRQKLIEERSRTRAEKRTATIERVPDPASFDLSELCEAEWEQHVYSLAVEKVKQQVSAKHFQIFDLNVLKGWPAKRVAETLQVNTAFVHLTKHRVARRVKKEIEAMRHQSI